jgi:hypothetical protein
VLAASRVYARWRGALARALEAAARVAGLALYATASGCAGAVPGGTGWKGTRHPWKGAVGEPRFLIRNPRIPNNSARHRRPVPVQEENAHTMAARLAPAE